MTDEVGFDCELLYLFQNICIFLLNKYVFTNIYVIYEVVKLLIRHDTYNI